MRYEIIRSGTITASAVRFTSRLIDTSRIDTDAPLKKLRESQRKLFRQISSGLPDSSKLTAVAISQLLSRKYTTANSKSPGKRVGRLVACCVRGGTPVTKKKSSAANQIDRDGAVVLNKSLWNPIRFLHSHNEMIKPSSVTVRVPAAVPNNSTDVKTKVSETEIDASIPGSLMVIEPLSSVSAARTNHCDVTGVAPRA